MRRDTTAFAYVELVAMVISALRGVPARCFYFMHVVGVPNNASWNGTSLFFYLQILEGVCSYKEPILSSESMRDTEFIHSSVAMIC